MRRAPGTGSVFRPSYCGPGGALRRQRPYWIAYRVGPVEKREPAKTASRAEAEALLRKRLAALDRGETKAVRDTATFAALAKLIRDDYRANGHRSESRLELNLRHLKEAFDGDRAGAITTPRITAYCSRRLEAGASRATVNRELAALKRAFRLAHRSGRVTAPPYIPMLREDNARTGFFERADFGRLLRRLPRDLRPFAITAYVTGWRVPSEILTRQWRHVDLKRGWLRLEPGETKSGRGRQFPFTPSLWRALRAQRAATPTSCPHVFHHDGVPLVYRVKAGGWVSHQYLRTSWATACAAAGLAGRIPHDFRRTAARDLLRAGVPVPTVMAALGWTSQAMLQRYAIVDEGDLLEAAAKRARLRRL